MLYDASMNRGRLMMMFALALAGCAFSGAEGEGEGGGDGTGSGTGNGTGGGGGSNTTDPPRCKFMFVDVCGFKDAAGPALTYSSDTTIDTSVNTSCPRVVTQASGPELCLFYNASLTIAANVTVRAIGTRPIAFVTTGNMSLLGRLDASSSRASQQGAEVLGAGAASGTCDAFAKAPETDTNGGGGGAGASFSGKGGNGGAGNITGPGGGNSEDGGKRPTPRPRPT